MCGCSLIGVRDQIFYYWLCHFYGDFEDFYYTDSYYSMIAYPLLCMSVGYENNTHLVHKTHRLGVLMYDVSKHPSSQQA